LKPIWVDTSQEASLLFSLSRALPDPGDQAQNSHEIIHGDVINVFLHPGDNESSFILLFAKGRMAGMEENGDLILSMG